ncbi:nicotinate-nucleotide adenylyltransferase [Granulicella arctica]|uniref:Probable nicotinate-nucleotide adenylyltransferase n=1 Tax=Granulicella arctica TaxID=940613 RepID=A0A7Y9PGI3_9BACT|nr:nicotinate-nucleotide adenylyltransferase [Granulicella arctica]NYF78726.1 nicotinate-nucleotide adenylyltransferase [Granulicella arctica]
MRVAFFGGTFDPIHRGHLAIAAAAADHLALDSILFAPTGLQPLKLSGSTATFDDRLAMTTLACATDPRFEPSTLDAPRADGSPNYTVHVLTALREQLPTATLFNLVGLDSFLDLPRWHQPHRLLELTEWIVVSRPGYTLDLSAFTPAQRTRIHPLDSVHEDVSATELRHRLQHGDPCLDLIPASVSTYIEAHRLYR